MSVPQPQLPPSPEVVRRRLRRLTITLLVVAGLAVGGCCAVGVPLYAGLDALTKESQEHDARVDRYLSALSRRDADGVYGELCAGLQGELGLAGVREAVQKFPRFTRWTGYRHDRRGGRRPRDGVSHERYNLFDGSEEVLGYTIRFVEENDVRRPCGPL